ncbi:dihydrofolate reductase [uncultured Lactobacillus sp.]|uniref:dihydrofolate reductase n=1 Tax=uncultured Lactobacillus sp. TaxID=153152 RepID=UPI002611FBAF|nr:dihydrofolate reductase [uncultured Lactobacillus sp.]
MIKLIWAEDQEKNIGYQESLPWYLPADLAHFKRETLGHIIVMGSKTFDSLPKVLPKRVHWILTHHPDKYQDYFTNPQVKIFTDLDQLKKAIKNCQEDIYVIGGKSLFDQVCDIADQLIVTKIHASFKGDVKAPMIKEQEFKLVSQTQFESDEKNKYNYEIDIYQKLV